VPSPAPLTASTTPSPQRWCTTVSPAAIVGASRPEQVEDNVGASGVELGDDVLRRIDEILGGVLVAAPAGD